MMTWSYRADGVRFRPVLPEGLDRKPFPAFPPSARLAVVVGQPTEPAPDTNGVKVPFCVRPMPHSHPEDRVDTVISGVFYIRLGEHFDSERLDAYPPPWSSFFPVALRTSAGRRQVSTSRRCRRSGAWPRIPEWPARRSLSE